MVQRSGFQWDMLALIKRANRLHDNENATITVPQATNAHVGSGTASDQQASDRELGLAKTQAASSGQSG